MDSIESLTARLADVLDIDPWDLEVHPPGEFVLPIEHVERLLSRIPSKRRLPRDYWSIAEAYRRDAEPVGGASVDIGSDVNARVLDGSTPGMHNFGVRIKDEFIVILSPDGSVAVRGKTDYPPIFYTRMRRFVPGGVVVEREGVTDRYGRPARFTGDWIALSPDGSLSPDRPDVPGPW